MRRFKPTNRVSSNKQNSHQPSQPAVRVLPVSAHVGSGATAHYVRTAPRGASGTACRRWPRSPEAVPGRRQACNIPRGQGIVVVVSQHSPKSPARMRPESAGSRSKGFLPTWQGVHAFSSVSLMRHVRKSVYLADVAAGLLQGDRIVRRPAAMPTIRLHAASTRPSRTTAAFVPGNWPPSTGVYRPP